MNARIKPTARSTSLSWQTVLALSARSMTFQGVDALDDPSGRFVARASDSRGNRAEALGASPVDAIDKLTRVLVAR